MAIDHHISCAGKSLPTDRTFYLPDECLAFIFHSLLHDDRERCSLVCRRWLRIEGQTRRRLTLSLDGSTQSDIIPSIPSIFARFDSVTELSLKGGCPLVDETLILILISLECKNLTRLTLHGCDITVEALSKNCARLKIISFGSTSARRMKAMLDNSVGLEELHLQRVCVREPFVSDAAATSLKVICVEEIDDFDFDVNFFAQLIKASKSLRTLKLVSLRFPPLSTLLYFLSDTTTEIHLEHVVVSDLGLFAISSCCPNLEILRLVKFFGNYCSADGIVTVAKRCNLLKILHIDDFWCRGWEDDDQIWDEGLMAVAKNCPNLEELLLDGVRVTQLSLEMLGAKCVKLERLTLCGGIDVSDAELMCIAAKCNALKKLWIEYCPVSNSGIQALASGCPNLAQVMFRECEALTLKCINQLRASRVSLVVDFDKDGTGRAKRPPKQLVFG